VGSSRWEGEWEGRWREVVIEVVNRGSVGWRRRWGDRRTPRSRCKAQRTLASRTASLGERGKAEREAWGEDLGCQACAVRTFVGPESLLVQARTRPTLGQATLPHGRCVHRAERRAGYQPALWWCRGSHTGGGAAAHQAGLRRHAVVAHGAAATTHMGQCVAARQLLARCQPRLPRQLRNQAGAAAPEGSKGMAVVALA
jgi:hypothetical protein